MNSDHRLPLSRPRNGQSAAGIPVLTTYATHTAANNYPPLPIRTDCVFVWFTRFADRADYDSRMTALRSSARWNGSETAERVEVGT
jgi:hypothetical protein